MSDPYRLRYTNQAVGIFLLIVLLFLIVFTVWVLRAGDYFVEPHTYWIEVPQEDVRDLYKGAEVMILGERAGEVDSIRYVDSTDRVRVNLSIDPEMSDQIFHDSVVRQDRKFGLGTPILTIRRGDRADDDRRQLPPGNPLRSYTGESDRIDKVAKQVETVSESIRLIQESLEPTLQSMTAATEQLRESLVNRADPAMEASQLAAGSFYQSNEQLRPEMSQTLEVVRDATRSLEGRIDDLVTNDVRQTLADMRESTANISRAAESITQTSEDTNADVAETLASLREAADQVQRLATDTQELVRVVRGEAGELPGTTERFNETVSDTQAMVGEIRSHWLLRNSRGGSRSSSRISPSRVRGGTVRP